MGNILIALSGWAKSGKDTAAAILIDKAFSRVAFADPLKEMVATTYKIPLEWLHQQDKKEIPLLDLKVQPQDAFSVMISNFLIKEYRTSEGKTMPFMDPVTGKGYEIVDGQVVKSDIFWTPRALAIFEGSGKRTVRSDYWVQAALDKSIPLDRVVIPDMRYRSELNQIKNWGAKIGRRTVTVRINRYDSTSSVDPSERDLDLAQFDWTIDNRGSLQELENSLETVLQEELFKE